MLSLDEITEYKPNYTPKDFKNMVSSRNGGPRTFEVNGHSSLVECVHDDARCIPQKKYAQSKFYLAHGRYDSRTGTFVFSGREDFVPENRYIYICKKAKYLQFRAGNSIVVEYRKADKEFIDRNKDRIIICYSNEAEEDLRSKVDEGVFLLSKDGCYDY